MAVSYVLPIFHADDSNGAPLVGGLLYTYANGTTTPEATYQDAAGLTPNANPIVLDTRGEGVIFLTAGQYYTFVLKTSTGTTVWTQDDIIGPVLPSQLSGTAGWCSVSGTADAIALTPGVAIAAYAAGQVFQFTPSAGNTGAATVAVSGLAAKDLKRDASTALLAGDLVSGKLAYIQFDGTQFQLLNPSTLNLTTQPVSTSSTAAATCEFVMNQTATDARKGIVELATAAEYATGTDTERAMTPAVARAQNLVQGTVQTTLSGTSKDFTSIPSWVKRIVVMFNGVSTNGTSRMIVQIGDAGGIENSGYLSTGYTIAGASLDSNAYTDGFGIGHTHAATDTYGGHIILHHMGDNVWTAGGLIVPASNATKSCAGIKTLSATLDRIRITTQGGTDAFDAGSVNIIYE